MRKLLFILMFCFPPALFSQTSVDGILSEEQVENVLSLDSNNYDKSIDILEKKIFDEDFKDRYTEKDFIYTDDIKPPPKESKPIDLGFLSGFISFIQVAFPFLVGVLIIFIILKVTLGAKIGFWNFKNSSKNKTGKLIFQKEEEEIYETDFEILLKKAIEGKEFRFATRYCYLLILRRLSDKEKIKYDKNKTNADYLLEIENAAIRKEFNHISYLYSYVWYGKFSINDEEFDIIQGKYTSLIKAIN